MILKKYYRFLPVIVWMVIIFYFSSQSTAGITYTGTSRFLLLKSFHLIEYGVLAILWFHALSSTTITILFSYLYAISDEIHQSYTPGRGPKFTDTLIDLLGIIIGLIIIKYLRTIYFRKS